MKILSFEIEAKAIIGKTRVQKGDEYCGRVYNRTTTVKHKFPSLVFIVRMEIESDEIYAIGNILITESASKFIVSSFNGNRYTLHSIETVVGRSAHLSNEEKFTCIASAFREGN